MTPGSLEMARRLHRVPFIAALLSTCVGLALWSRHRYVLDDAFITFRYAQHLSEGLGPVFNSAERVEGYTNPLWMLLNAGALTLGLDPLQTSRAIGLASFGLSTLLAAAIVAPLVTRPFALALCAPLLALGLVSHLVDFAGSGLEHGLWGLCVLALGRELLSPPALSRDVRINALCLLALLTRLDAAPFVGVHAIVSAGSEWRLNQNASATLRALARRYGFALVLFAAYLATKYAYYGALLPNTFYAKRAGAVGLLSGLSYVWSFVTSYPQLWLALPLCALGTLKPPRSEFTPFARWAGASLTLYFAYLALVGGDFMMYRLALQPYATLMVLCALGLASALALRPILATACALGVLCLAPGWPEPDRRFYMQSFDEMHRYYLLGSAVGRVLEQRLPQDTVIATTLAGTLPFYARLTTIDQLGLNDHWIARHGALFPRSRGHTRRAPQAYLQAREVNLVFDHPATTPCKEARSKGKPRVFVRIEGARCVGADYLVPKANLTVHLCQHSEWFVLDHVRCPDTTPARGLQLLNLATTRGVSASVHTTHDVPTTAPNKGTQHRGGGVELRGRRPAPSSPQSAALR